MWHLEIENVAGIRSGSTELHPGTNAVQASNWQGKTSLLTAIRVVMGAEVTPSVLTEGEDSGHVELTTDDEATYRVDLQAENDQVVRTGTPYLGDSQDRLCAELFAFLDEWNEIRHTVRNGGDLMPLLTRPLEEENIDAQVADLKSERRRAETELERAKEATTKLQRKEEQARQLESELEDLRAELAEFEAEEGAGQPDDSPRDELNEARTSHERTQQAINRQQRQIESMESELEEKEEALEALEVPDEPDLQHELEQKRDRLDELEEQIDTLQTLYNANQQVLDRDQLNLVADVDRQISGDTVTCWVCDNETSREAIETRLAELGTTITTKRDAVSDLQQEVNDLEDQRRRIKQQRQQRQDLEREISELQSRLQERRDDLASNREKLAELSSKIEELEDRVQETDDRQKTLEEEIVRKEAKLEDLQEEINELEQQADQRDAIKNQIEEISAEIEDLRSRRERTIEEARTAFEAALEDVVDNFGPSFQAARLDKHTDPDTGRTEKLELIIARGGREITVDRLSEGEVELVGFIAALAGYEAFDVADRVPCILLDDVGGLASEHLHTLVTYLEGRTGYLVTSAYPEAGDFDGYTISPAEWTVVSDREETPA